jgi:hypothetical protein
MDSMTKTEIYEFFDRKIAKRAIKDRDGEWVIVGKTCIIVVDDDGLWDFWICNPRNLAAGLGQGACNNRILALRGRTQGPIIEVNGEAWGKVAGTEIKSLILDNLSLFGISKKREVSQASLDRFQAMRVAGRV